MGNDVWVGQNSLIKQGVTIGHGSIIGMGSVVTKDIEPYTIVGGVPAKKIKLRFSEDTISQLLKSKWWELKENELSQVAKNIKNPKKFIESLKNSNF
ncbi:MAG: acetyltransferase [Flavobacteriales bacterium]|nr:acetyltransferase [Flavobacteriales bacterium]